MISAPLLLVIIPLLVAPVVYLLRRWAAVAALLSTGLCLFMALMTWRLALDQPVRLWGRQVAAGETLTVLGRELVMTEADQLELVFIYVLSAALFVYAWRVSQGWTFFPLGLALLAVINAALIVESHLFAVLLLEIAAALLVFLIQGGQTRSTRGALRFLTLMTLGLPAILLTSWLLSQYELDPDNLQLLETSARLFAFGFAVLLGVVPFHTWVSAVAVDAPPLVATFVFGVFNGAVLFVMLDLLESFEWLATHPDLGQILAFGGYSMIAVGGFLVLVQRELGRIMGYAALIDMGACLVALSLRTPAGLQACLFSLGTRTVSLTVMAMGLSLIRHRAQGDDFERIAGWGQHVPWATIAFAVGGLSLAGIPPGAGFPARWAVARLLGRERTAGAILLLVASLAVGIALARGLMALLRPPLPDYVGSEIVEQDSKKEETPPTPEQEPRLATVMLVVALLVCLGLGLWPQIHTAVIERAADTYTFLSLITP